MSQNHNNPDSTGTEVFSKRFPGTVFDLKGRRQKALKIVAVLSDAIGQALKRAEVLDLGCAAGIVSNELATQVSLLVGTDLDRNALSYAHQNREPNSSFLAADAQILPFRDASFDVVICAHVYEHVTSAEVLVKEIHRVLRVGGVCYFAAGNRLALIEPHYRLPFLSVLPISLANVILRATGRGHVYGEKHLTYWSLKRLVSRFQILDYTGRIVNNPQKYAAEDVVPIGSLKQTVGRSICRITPALAPTFIFLLKKVY